MEDLDLRLPAMKPRVAVIGAGWAGLAAAVELAGQADLTLFEAGRQAGGRARRVSSDGNHVDNGQHILLGAYETCWQLMRKVGADPDRLLHRLPLNWWQADGLQMRCPSWPAPWHLLAGLLSARGLPWSGKGQLLRALGRLALSGWQVAADQTVAEWLQQQGQGAALQQVFWRPLVLSALNTPPEQAAMSVLAAVLRDSLGARRAASDMMLPRTDLSALFPEPALAWLAAQGATLCLGQRVGQLQAAGQGVRVDGQPFDAAIVACAPYHLPHLLPDDLLPAAVKKLDYWPIYTVYLRFAQAPQLPRPMIGLREGTADWLFDREALCGEAGMLAAVISAPQAGRLPEGALALAEAVLADVRRIRPDLPAPVWSKVLVERRATFAATPGMVRPGVRLNAASCYLAGDWCQGLYPATLEGAVRSGVAAAGALLQDMTIMNRQTQ
ncbi:hydroxysqualene dehydroxylase HpnE [Paludibacterium sp. B53371]|uniref:hydroxysqualene dehydroxylase HpnE n=1 Tax=Paludibacterium sp. B53371 TaxID=2806263 RepID=UPI00207B43EA|nr:hydroxysqualene dehydroxylase HpnE [Paludibacterium sp. B53371]